MKTVGRLEKAVYEALSSSDKPLHVREIYAEVKKRVPDLCDDTITPCPYCKQNHPLWQHKTQWALQYLKQRKLAQSTSRGYWQALKPKEVGKEVISEIPISEPIHESLKSKIKSVGEVLGKKVHTEFQAPPYVYDVVWKEFEGLPPSHVFEIQDKGSVNGALSKLQHARDMWRSKLFLIVTGEKDRAKIDQLLKPYWQGAFHKIGKQTLVLSPEVIGQIHEIMSSYPDVIRRFIED